VVAAHLPSRAGPAGTLVDRLRWAAPAGVLVLLLGVVASKNPLIAVGLAGATAVVALAFAAPAANLVLILLTTAVIPYSVQNQLAGRGSRGLILSDLLLLAGLLRAVPALVGGLRVERRQRLLLAPLAAFFLMVVYQFVRGVALGNDASVAGAELRTLLGFSSFVVALPVLADERLRHRLFNGMLFVGLLLGAWGMAQWLFDLSFVGDFGVREGINFTTSGRGQLQGGLYAFPVAAVLGFAVLVSGAVQERSRRHVIAAATALNLLCVLLTYERTFWVTTVLAMGFVALKAGRGPRSRALVAGPAIVVVVLAAMATFAPAALGSARERLLSLGQYASDGSLRYRIVESGHVVDEIRARPALGAGLGATIVWSRPWEGVPPRTYDYSHNGYLWLAWKVGLPTALLLFGSLFVAAAWRAPGGDPLERSIRLGSQAAMLLLLVSSVTFPSFNAFGITATMGVLTALCATAPATSGPAGSRAERVLVPAG
jgi:hypothetical protein